MTIELLHLMMSTLIKFGALSIWITPFEVVASRSINHYVSFKFMKRTSEMTCTRSTDALSFSLVLRELYFWLLEIQAEVGHTYV